MSLASRDPWLLLAMGDECLDAGDLAGAERLFKQARRAARHESAPAAALAALALARRDDVQARKWLGRAEELDASDPRLVSIRSALGLPPRPLQAASSEPTAKGATVAPAPEATPPPAPN